MMKNSLLYLLSFLILFQIDNGSSVVSWCVFNLLEKEGGTSSCVAAEPRESATLHNLTAGVDEEDEVVVYLCSSSYSLDNSAAINFTDKKNVSIIGLADGSSLNCHDNNTGLYFRNVSTLTVEHITLSHCGLCMHKSLISFYVEDCINIFMTNIGIFNSSGAGLALVNNSGIITINNSSFHDNHGLNKDEGGLVIYSTKHDQLYEIRKCNFTHNNYFQGSGLNVQLRGQSRDIDILVVDCIFLANTATLGGAVFIFLNNSQNLSLTISESFFGNDEAVGDINEVGQFDANTAMQGGAIYIAFHGNSHDISINISQSSFRNNKAIYKDGVSEDGHKSSGSSIAMQGGALCITFLESSHDITLEISHSNFDNNKAKSEEMVEAAMHGGALYFAFQNNSNNISVEISGSIFGNYITFLNKTDDSRSCSDANTAEHGGAVYIIFMENSQDISFSVSRSTFGNVSDSGVSYVANTAKHAGGAIYTTFQNNSKNITLKISQTMFGSRSVNTAFRGGAVYISFQGYSHNIVVSIYQSIFGSGEVAADGVNTGRNSCRVSNTNTRGGALYIAFQEYSDNITFNIVGSNFTNNKATFKGGAIEAGYFDTPDDREFKRYSILFISCNFINNTADQLGGGLYLYADPQSHHFKKNFTFINCRWLGNNAASGSAVFAVAHDIEPSNSSLILMFTNCSFRNNSLNKSTCIENEGKGTLQTCSVHIIVSKTIEFADNLMSAVYMELTILEVSSDTNLTFNNNHGERGGAIRMQDNSNISMHDNSTVNFINNSACSHSGAIYYHNSSETIGRCFINYIGKTMNVSERNIILYFKNNTIIKKRKGHFGVSIFAASLLPCGQCPILETLNSIVTFKGVNNSNISTFAYKIKLEIENSPMPVIPGRRESISFLDETDTEVKEQFTVEIKNQSSKISLDPEYEGLYHKNLKLRGEPGNSMYYLILHLKNKDLPLHIILDHCPPGYVFIDDNKTCECSANTDFPYFGVKRCNQNTYQALLIHGVWAGYVSEQFRYETFRTSSCPLGYCSNQNNEIILPGNANSTVKKRLNILVCSKNRIGRVCGKCEDNTSMLFHTQGTFECGNNHCKYGILLYIISEIIPVTFLFVLIILLDVQLTTGALNSFLFYAQIFSTLTIRADSYVAFHKTASCLFEALNFILSFFNLTFFLHPRLSFCLFKGATFFHITIFNYVTVVYALLLVLLVIAVLNSKFNKVFVKLRKRNFSKSIIHGISGFLVICYARYTNASLRILTPVTLYGKNAKAKERVLYYYGEINFFKHDHLPYAIPAIFILITMTLMPPFLLIFFPLYYKTLSLLKMEEPRFMKLLCRVIPLEKLMPFFDSFQGSFKDKYRYFAGLYFVYRVSALLIYSTASKMDFFYGVLSLQFILTLAIHAWIQPYKNKWHNRLDIYIFTILCIINGISLLNYENAVKQLNYQNAIDILSTLQVLLAYTPLLIMLAYFVFKMRFIVKAKCARKRHRKESDELELTLSMIDQSRDIEYKKCVLP